MSELFPFVFLGLPTYDGSRVNAMSFLGLNGCKLRFRVQESACSLLAHGFNMLWCAALNHQPRPDWFLMWHADIVPLTNKWPEVMVAEAERVGADVLSVVVPIKGSPETSTSVETDNIWRPKRLTLEECWAEEMTFTRPGLLVNTGMMLVRFGPWCERVWFTIRDKVACVGGVWTPAVEPEDWYFSRRARELGKKVYATTAVQLDHVGRSGTPNYERNE